MCYLVIGCLIFLMIKIKYCMSFVDMFLLLSEILFCFKVNIDIKRSFRKGLILRGFFEKKFYWCNWFCRKKNKLNF